MPKFATGGVIKGPRPNPDEIPVWLSDGYHLAWDESVENWRPLVDWMKSVEERVGGQNGSTNQRDTVQASRSDNRCRCHNQESA